MKKVVLSILILSTCLTGCNKELNLYDAGIEVTSTMESLLKDENYIDLLGFTDSLESSLEYFVASDYDSPTKVYSLSNPDYEKVCEIYDIELSGLSSEAKEQLIERLGNIPGIINMINSKTNSKIDQIIISSSFTCSLNFKGYNIDDQCSYLYVFETGKPILVAYSNTYEGCCATGYFVLLQDPSLSNVRDTFEPYGCEVEVVK